MRKTALLHAILLVAISVSAQVRTQAPTVVVVKPVLTTRAATGPQADSIYAIDIAASFDQMEQQVEVFFARLKREIRDEIPHINEAIKQLPANLAPLNRQMNRLQAELGKIDQWQTRFNAMMDSIKQSPGGGLLNGDRIKMQHRIDSLSTQRISLQDQIKDLNGRINMQVAANNEEKKNLQKQIAALDMEIAELDKQKPSLITDIRQQKQKILAQLAKMIREQQMRSQEYRSIITDAVNSYANGLQENLQRFNRRQK